MRMTNLVIVANHLFALLGRVFFQVFQVLSVRGGEFAVSPVANLVDGHVFVPVESGLEQQPLPRLRRRFWHSAEQESPRLVHHNVRVRFPTIVPRLEEPVRWVVFTFFSYMLDSGFISKNYK